MTTPPDPGALEWIRASDDPSQECFEVAAGEGGLIHIRQSDEPERIVTTTRAKWRAFVLGVHNDEFDHFVREGPGRATGGGAGGAHTDGS
ncbi:DUF397 domain-containing protein [Streptomyces sp. XM4193]|uniref:DUF397 domain-containing protein n=1 Tax=Streptomyces sp. XM4193 TaxID=2929782 RepID=UPI001FF94BAD|nr:DUF397 domain-containing protein [Streptomyces sp. XM4193]MCK1798236.1 DUF397 domain-containing protein [Streptomyces sp. XM4193]